MGAVVDPPVALLLLLLLLPTHEPELLDHVASLEVLDGGAQLVVHRLKRRDAYRLVRHERLELTRDLRGEQGMRAGLGRRRGGGRAPRSCSGSWQRGQSCRSGGPRSRPQARRGTCGPGAGTRRSGPRTCDCDEEEEGGVCWQKGKVAAAVIAPAVAHLPKPWTKTRRATTASGSTEPLRAACIHTETWGVGRQ